MELNEKLNRDYNKDKEGLKKAKRLENKVKELEQEFKMTIRGIQDAKIRIARAKEDGDKKAEKDAQTELETMNKKVESVKKKIENAKDFIKKSQAKVEGYIEELKKEPGFTEHVNGILEKRYNRKLARALKEEKQISAILDLCQKHPTLANNLRGMVRAQEELDRLTEEIDGLDLDKDETRLKEIKAKVDEFVTKKEQNMDLFMGYCSKNNIAVDREFLDNLISEKSFSHDKSGNININKTLKNLQKGYNRRILAYQNAITKIPNATLTEENKKSLGIVSQNVASNISNSTMTEENKGTSEIVPPPAKKYKWWEFRKRFQDWRARRKVASEEKKKEDVNDTNGVHSKAKEFRDSYKYDIVKDYVDKQEEEIYRQALKDLRTNLTDKEDNSKDEKENKGENKKENKNEGKTTEGPTYQGDEYSRNMREAAQEAARRESGEER